MTDANNKIFISMDDRTEMTKEQELEHSRIFYSDGAAAAEKYIDSLIKKWENLMEGDAAQYYEVNKDE